MGQIISPVPIEIHISFSEIDGKATYRFSRAGQPVELPLPMIVGIFSQIQLSCVQEVMTKFGATLPGKTPGETPNGRLPGV
jgi:hypothetical protein